MKLIMVLFDSLKLKIYIYKYFKNINNYKS